MKSFVMGMVREGEAIAAATLNLGRPLARFQGHFSDSELMGHTIRLCDGDELAAQLISEADLMLRRRIQNGETNHEYKSTHQGHYRPVSRKVHAD